MPRRWAERLRKSLERGRADKIFPGGICRLITADQVTTVACGQTEAAGEWVDEATVYDLASLTKVVVTLPLILLSVQRGRLSLSESVVSYLPELLHGSDSEGKRTMTVMHLLTHTSGLPAWRPFYIACQGRQAYLEAIAQEPLAAPPGQRVIYSDLGFILLGFLVERIWDAPLDELADTLLFAPLEMRQTTYNPRKRWPEGEWTIAPTEDGNRFERELVERYLRSEPAACGQPLYAQVRERRAAFRWRQGVIRGTVHDGNAYYGLGGVSGHAGLFATVGDLERYMRIWTEADGAGLLDPLLRDFAIRCQTGPLAPRRAIGWALAATGDGLEQVPAGCSDKELVSPVAFGHTGFTGTSIWCDPLRQATLVTLTNRVHPVVSEQMVTWRKQHHDYVFAGLAAACHPEQEEGSGR